MKKILPIVVLMIGAMNSALCQENEYHAPDTPFAMLVPAWDPKSSNDKLNVLSMRRGDRQCYFDLNVVGAPLDQYRQLVESWAKKQDATIVSQSPLVYDMTTPDKKYTFRTKTKGLFCAGKTYFAFTTCLDTNFADELSEKIFASMRCGGALPKQGASNQTPVPAHGASPGPRSNPKLGLIVSPANGFSAESVKDAYRIAREAGAEITRHYISFSDIEKSKGNRVWKGNDFIVNVTRDSGMRVSLTFLIIRTAVLGSLPSDIKFRGWKDPVLTERFKDFALDYIERYRDVIDYVEIGAEVNAYFARHPNELDDYVAFYENIYKAIKARFPKIKVGTVLAYHEMRNSGDFSIYGKLNKGDFVGFTLYPHGPNFSYGKDPKIVKTDLDEIANLTNGRPFALEEVGWSPWPSLHGSDESQKKAVDYFFDFLESAPPGLEFMNWFILHDMAQRDCDRTARTFVKSNSRLAKNKEMMKSFADFLCHMGLRTNDGTDRPAWVEYKKRAKELKK